MIMQRKLYRSIICDSFKLAYTKLHYNSERMKENYAILDTSHSKNTVPVWFVWLHQPQMNRTYNIVPERERKLNRYDIVSNMHNMQNDMQYILNYVQ